MYEKFFDEIESIGPAAAGANGVTPELVELLISDGPDGGEADALREALFARAVKARAAASGDKIFMYGFAYFSTWCRNNCNFCYFRSSNDIERYRKDPGEIIDTAERLVESGVNLVDLTMGEDSVYRSDGFDKVLSIVRSIKERTGAPVMISAGVVPPDAIRALADVGADFFALYQETHNRELFAKLRAHQDYDERMNCKLEARAAGMRIEEGILTGVGETAADLVDSLAEMGRIGASQMRAMSFVPQKGSPMEGHEKGDKKRELVFIALLRLLYPHALIPASLDVDGFEGLVPRISAGANLVTSIIPPRSGYQGVAQSELDIDEGTRTVSEVSEALKRMGLSPATMDEYRGHLAEMPR
ncbi:MAG: methylornithine synthase PylB [Clostridiales Family XIII bacterium]|jgi:methylornithine synthase|nr:methylornithine synthase PylB [Clostridiales Family XIII bacterium]